MRKRRRPAPPSIPKWRIVRGDLVRRRAALFAAILSQHGSAAGRWIAPGAAALPAALAHAGAALVQVEVVSGRDRGKQGVVQRVLRKQNRILVEGVNMVRKHVRPDGQNPGGIFSVEAALHVSNVNLVDPVSG